MTSPESQDVEGARSIEALRQSEERFRLMIEAVKDYAIYLLDPEGNVASWNEGAERIKGYKADEVLGKHFSIFYPPEAIANKWPDRELEEAKAEGSFEEDGWRVRKDGSRFYANVVITALRDPAGRLIGFTKITRDLSEKRQQDEALRRSEERFRLMVEAVKDYAIFLLDPQGCIVSWNEGAERLKGYAFEDVRGKHFSIFYPDEALERGWPEYELKVAREKGRFEDEGWRIRKDGSRFWANVVITALWTDDGRHIGFTKVTRDLTERRRHEEELRLSEQRLERAYEEVSRRNRELRDFARVASHDLQEPLRKVGTFAELLDSEYRDVLEDTGRLYIERIRYAAARMSDLINDLLSYSRVSTQQMPLQAVDLNSILEDSIGDLQVLLEESDGTVDREPLPTIQADPTQMRQLFQNLVGNALKYHRPGVAPHVRVSAEIRPAPDAADAGKIAEIRFEDNGIGFDEQHVDAIFEPFKRLHTSGEYEGTGLGLAICKRIVERHGGSMTARSRPGEGSTFIVTLPIARENASET